LKKNNLKKNNLKKNNLKKNNLKKNNLKKNNLKIKIFCKIILRQNYNKYIYLQLLLQINFKNKYNN